MEVFWFFFGCSFIWLISGKLIYWIGRDIQNAPRVSHNFSLQLTVHFFPHSLYLMYSYYNMDYLYKEKKYRKNRKLKRVHILNTQKKKLTLESKTVMILTLFYFLIWQSTKGTQQLEGNRLSVNRDDTGMGETPTCYGRKVEGEVLAFFFSVYFAVTTWVLTQLYTTLWIWESETTIFVIFVIHNLKSVFWPPLTPKILLVILLTVCHTIIMMSIWRNWYWIN